VCEKVCFSVTTVAMLEIFATISYGNLVLSVMYKFSLSVLQFAHFELTTEILYSLQ